VQTNHTVYIGWDSREVACSHVLANSITKRTSSPLTIQYLNHRELRKSGHFNRMWTIDKNGEFIDVIDGKTFSTEFSHSRFLIPHLMNYEGWALFTDCDMVFLSDIKKLFALADDKYAVMCVKHHHKPENETKMDGRHQAIYYRKNWSSFVLWNCGHPANKILTAARVNSMRGSDLHAFVWLNDQQIGSLPTSYNFISGVSPKLPPERGGMPDVIHYTEGGPWFDNCQDVPYAGIWIREFEDWQSSGAGNKYTSLPSTAFEPEEVVRK